ncbi:MAG: transaldolase [Bacteroidia bacterium]|nr:transaldolase [Bacteroidia bacterium]
MNSLRQLQAEGQAVWLDYIRRDILLDGSLRRMVAEDGVSGVTSNPAIFQKAIGESDLYDSAIEDFSRRETQGAVESLYEALVVEDIRLAADILTTVFESTNGRDGFVSLEVSPHLARDAQGTVAEARHLWRRVDRPNLMIKVPATAECIPAVEQLLADGINVNVTLMFSLGHYEAVAQAYLRGLERCQSPESVASVASFFVSRVDTKVDGRLEELGGEAAAALLGKIAIANSKLTYARYKELFEAASFQPMRDRGAAAQRVLWASTSTKSPAYRDVIYVEELVGSDTVNTIPPETLEAFRDHGKVRPSLLENWSGARQQIDELAALGIDLQTNTEELQKEGLEKFAKPFDSLLETLAHKRDSLREGVSASSTVE